MTDARGRIRVVAGRTGSVRSHRTHAQDRAGCEVGRLVTCVWFASWHQLGTCHVRAFGRDMVAMGALRDPHGVQEAMRECASGVHRDSERASPYAFDFLETGFDKKGLCAAKVGREAVDLEVRTVRRTSSGEEHGSTTFVLLTQGHPLYELSPDSASKVAADQITMLFHNSFGTMMAPYTTLNTFDLLQCARPVDPPVIMQGAMGELSLMRRSMSPRRDFTVRWNSVVMFRGARNSQSDVCQVAKLGSSFEGSTGKTAQAISAVAVAEIKLVTDAQRLRPSCNEVERLWTDNNRPKSILAWEPRFAERRGFWRELTKALAWSVDSAPLTRDNRDGNDI